MRAVRTLSELGQAALVEDAEIPSVAAYPAHVLVKPRYVGLNHCDYFTVDHPVLFHPHITLGSEFVGEVVAVGAECEGIRKVGERVAGCTFTNASAMPHAGCHADYFLVRGDTLLLVDNMGDSIREEQAAGLGVAFSTVFQTMYHLMKLPVPSLEKQPQQDDPAKSAKKRIILIAGGSTNTGMIAIQFAKLSGLTVLTTCSPHNFALLKNLGADAVFDYKDTATCIASIQAAIQAQGLDGKEPLLALDCVGTFNTPEVCAGVLPAGSTYVATAPPSLPGRDGDDVTLAFAQGQQVLGDSYTFNGQTVPASPEISEPWKAFARLSERLIGSGRIKLSPVQVQGGLEEVVPTLALLREWKFSATKAVCKV
ncbi:zinc-binding oxidoreductase ToxD [Apiospora arundinis]